MHWLSDVVGRVLWCKFGIQADSHHLLFVLVEALLD
jgi:hypothetical protein